MSFDHSILGAMALLSSPAIAVHGPAHPVWAGRPRARRSAPLDKPSTFGIRVKDGKKHAPPGYAFNGRGDLISLKREARRQRARERAA